MINCTVQHGPIAGCQDLGRTYTLHGLPMTVAVRCVQEMTLCQCVQNAEAYGAFPELLVLCEINDSPPILRSIQNRISCARCQCAMECSEPETLRSAVIMAQKKWHTTGSLDLLQTLLHKGGLAPLQRARDRGQYRLVAVLAVQP